MRTSKRIGIAAVVALGAWTAQAADFVPEEITVGKLPPAKPTRLYVSDVAISHIIDGRLHIVEGDTLEYAGVVGTGLTGLATLSPDRSEIYVATTYLAKLNRGTRTDQVDVYDSHSLELKAEIEIPPKHAQALPYKGTIAVTPDGRFIIVQNATPASSITVVDRKAAKFVTEIPTPGCWSILPAQSVANRFSTVCGDGTLLTITLDGSGKPAGQERSERLFDPDRDPVFTQTENDGDTYHFLSFHGQVHSANLGGPVAKIGDTWSLLGADDREQNWRPGGYQPFALDKAAGRLYVAMHPNGAEGSHKNPAVELWAFDLAKKQRIERVEGNNAVSLAVSRGEQPTLFAIDPLSAGLISYSTSPKLAVGKRVDGFGEAPILLETH
jgi:methylamine dehydrogenase heavy chain